MIFYQVLAENVANEGIVGFSNLATILQALGGVIVLYLIFNVVMVIINRKRNKKIDEIFDSVGNMDRNIAKMNANIEEMKNLLKKK